MLLLLEIQKENGLDKIAIGVKLVILGMVKTGSVEMTQ